MSADASLIKFRSVDNMAFVDACCMNNSVA